MNRAGANAAHRPGAVPHTRGDNLPAVVVLGHNKPTFYYVKPQGGRCHSGSTGLLDQLIAQGRLIMTEKTEEALMVFKKPYGLGWIFFWCLLFFPIGIIMTIINLSGGRLVSLEKKPSDLNKVLSGSEVLLGFASGGFMLFMLARCDGYL